MYNLSQKMYQLDYKSGSELTDSDISSILMEHNRSVVKIMDRLEDYANGYNTTIKNKPDKAENVPNNRKAYAYGKRIVDTITNYLISSEPKYSCVDEDYLSEIKTIQLINDNMSESKDIIYNLVTFGMAGKIFYYDNNANVRYASIDPREFVPVYNYDVNPQLLAVIRYYTVTDSKGKDKMTYVDVYTDDNIRHFKGTSLNVISSDNTDTPHDFKQVPCAVYGGWNYSGMLYHVLDQIDAYDQLQNSDLNEIQKHALALLVFSDGASISSDDLRDAMDKGGLALPQGMSVKDAIAYLTKDINAAFNIDVRNNQKQEIFDLSTVPDFMSSEFSAQSGVALQYKLIGFDNSAKQVEEYFHQGESKSVDIMTATFDATWQNRAEYYKQYPDRVVSVNLIENLPTDVSAQLQHALILKNLGIPETIWLDALPAEYIGNNKQFIIDELAISQSEDVDYTALDELE